MFYTVEFCASLKVSVAAKHYYSRKKPYAVVLKTNRGVLKSRIEKTGVRYLISGIGICFKIERLSIQFVRAMSCLFAPSQWCDFMMLV